MNKSDYAQKLGIKMRITVQSDVRDLYVDHFEACRVLSCLLDNAIEAAARSRKKRVLFTLQEQWDLTKTVLISNSVAGSVNIANIILPGVSDKQGHRGIGLVTVQKIVNQFPNCSLQLSCDGDEFFARLETRQSAELKTAPPPAMEHRKVVGEIDMGKYPLRPSKAHSRCPFL
jgi:two-component system sensor histidine kinase AgrC